MQTIDLFYDNDLTSLFDARKMDVLSYIKLLPAKKFEPEYIEKETKKLRSENFIKLPRIHFDRQEVHRSSQSVFNNPDIKPKSDTTNKAFLFITIPYSGSLDVLQYAPSGMDILPFEAFFHDQDKGVFVKEITLDDEKKADLFSEEIRLFEVYFKKLTKVIWEQNDLLDDFIADEIRKRSQYIQGNKDFVNGINQ